jgi:hypothetical protein
VIELSERKRRGAPKGNLNRMKSAPWLAEYDLTTTEGINQVLREATRRVWTGELGSRSGDTIVRLLNLLREGMATVDLEERMTALEKAAKQGKGGGDTQK